VAKAATKAHMPIWKRALLLCYDALGITAIAALLNASIPQAAFAYVDPSVMTYTIQALAGVAVAVAAVAGVAFRRTRKKLMTLLNIDENAHKAVEPPVSAVNPVKVPVPLTGSEPEDQAALQSKCNSDPSSPVPDSGPNFKRRLLEALLVAFFFSFTLFAVAPIEIVSGSSQSLSFTTSDILGIVFGLTLVVCALLTVLLLFLKERARTIAATVIFIAGFCCYIQAMFLNSGLPLADGSAVDWSQHIPIIALDTLVWLAIIALAAVTVRKRPAIMKACALVLSSALIIMQVVGVASILAKPTSSETVVTTEEGLTSVSAQSNVIVFVLDTFDQTILDNLQAENPDILAGFEGFTEYANATGGMIPTQYAIPYLLTGQAPQPGDTMQEYDQLKWERSTFLQDIQAAGYSLGIYSDSATIPASIVSNGLTINMHATSQHAINALPLLGKLVKCALYRDAPWLLKPLFWYYTDEINIAAVGETDASASSSANSSASSSASTRAYVTDDAATFAHMQEAGITADDASQAGAFRFIHLLGAHLPYTTNAQGEYAEGGTNETEQALGSLYIVQWYIDQLKALGVYDRTTIIVTGDHGYWLPAQNYISKAATPIYLIKQANAARTPLTTSAVPTGHVDFCATVLDAMGANASAYGTPTRAVSAGTRTRYYYDHYSNALAENYADSWIIEWVITGNAQDFSTWSRTGQEWQIS